MVEMKLPKFPLPEPPEIGSVIGGVIKGIAGEKGIGGAIAGVLEKADDTVKSVHESIKKIGE